jgi:cysteinyl-tRNA synthetase
VTVRVYGRSVRIESGQTMALGRITEMAAELASGHATTPADAAVRGSTRDATASADAGNGTDAASSVAAASDLPPLLGAIRAHEQSFRAARVASDVAAMVDAILSLDDELWGWSADTLQSDFLDRGRASLRAMVVELGELATVGARDPAGVVAPYVELALNLRDAARQQRRFEDADSVRDRLVALGIEVNDGAAGSTWRLANGTTSG